GRCGAGGRLGLRWRGLSSLRRSAGALHPVGASTGSPDRCHDSAFSGAARVHKPPFGSVAAETVQLLLQPALIGLQQALDAMGVGLTGQTAQYGLVPKQSAAGQLAV